jgi:hypothetical protein
LGHRLGDEHRVWVTRAPKGERPPVRLVPVEDRVAHVGRERERSVHASQDSHGAAGDNRRLITDA